MAASALNKGYLLKSRRNMKKNKTRHFETFSGESYPKILPQWGNMGKRRINNGALDQDPEVIATHSHNGIVTQDLGRIEGHEPDVKNDKQPSLDEIWKWLGNPDRE
jgi:hypothetical protein